MPGTNPDIMIDIIPGPIAVQEILSFVSDPCAGGIDLFIGMTRNHSSERDVMFLEYEAYAPMALNMMRTLAEEIRTTWNVRKIAIVHRIGRVNIGEASVVIAVSAEHRNEAFLACRHAIDRLKTDIPIWKKEYFHGGEAWASHGQKP